MKRRKLQTCVLGLLVSLPVSCGSLREDTSTLLDVPFLVQEEGRCGATALEMVLGYYGYEPDASLIVKRTQIPALAGTIPELLVEAAVEAGFNARIETGDMAKLDRWLEDGIPPIVLIVSKDRGQSGHFVVVTGVGRNGRTVRFHSGETRDRVCHTDEFMTDWQRGKWKTVLVIPRWK